MEVIAFISFFLGASWDFFTETTVPGFNFSFAALFVGLFLANLGLRFLFSMLGMSLDSHAIGGTISAFRPRSGVKNDPNYHSTSTW